MMCNLHIFTGIRLDMKGLSIKGDILLIIIMQNVWPKSNSEKYFILIQGRRVECRLKSTKVKHTI